MVGSIGLIKSALASVTNNDAEFWILQQDDCDLRFLMWCTRLRTAANRVRDPPATKVTVVANAKPDDELVVVATGREWSYQADRSHNGERNRLDYR